MAIRHRVGCPEALSHDVHFVLMCLGDGSHGCRGGGSRSGWSGGSLARGCCCVPDGQLPCPACLPAAQWPHLPAFRLCLLCLCIVSPDLDSDSLYLGLVVAELTDSQYLYRMGHEGEGVVRRTGAQWESKKRNGKGKKKRGAGPIT